ncbi:acyltransferase [Stieleria varia]|uniref:Streptogramin A acetyltransferase n=1 Tax=Stieleria varia TaxID=2528005 RepID=A0A5C6B3K8_9BACT|nr:acyltransferase [Stieleria varia]TWU05959.1 Streptogramin A acetyltransferase [Stieleria varia]
MLNWIRGLALLRFPEIVRDLGERRFHLQRIEEIQSSASGCKIDRDIRMIGYRKDLCDLSDRVNICGGTILAFGDELNGFGRISIGAETWIGEYNNLRAGGGDIVIGSGCLISQFCSLVASNHGTSRGTPIKDQTPPPHKRGVIIGNDVWIGASAIITPGVAVHRGAIVGAGSVVTRDIPEYEIWAGVPAKRIASRD